MVAPVLVGEGDLVIAGQRQAVAPQGVLFQRCERPCGAVGRTLTFPQAVDSPQARTEYRHGTCRIHLAKKHPSGETAERNVRAVERARLVLRFDVPWSILR